MTNNTGWFPKYLLPVLMMLVCACAGVTVADDGAQQPKTAQQVAPASNPNGTGLSAVHLDGNYFSRDGHRFIPVGANWVPAKAAMQWPTQWDPKAIEADFVRMHELGFNTIRLDFVWAWIEPRPGDYNPEAFRELDFLISLAHRYHIYLHP
ncbi:MAG: beta-galactosidase, partial [Candidatus Sulfotelmatobacter sp.]